MILLDWTRMGKVYCVAGVVKESGGYRVVRPLRARDKSAPVRNVGWFAQELHQRQRWEVFDLLKPEPAQPQPPHVEDLWVEAIRGRGATVGVDERRAILAATRTADSRMMFGWPLATTRSSAYMPGGMAQRSLATVVVPAPGVKFFVSQRQGAAEPDVRVSLSLPALGRKLLPVTDHPLRKRAEMGARDLASFEQLLNQAVRGMGAEVAVRLGLSRPYQSASGQPAVCWLMADGFFSLDSPQP
jgi:hypothetical protein